VILVLAFFLFEWRSALISLVSIPLSLVAAGLVLLLRGASVVFTVTDLTKVIDGVRNVVLYDLDYNAGNLVEAELAFHAQDDGGNVWNMGEYPEEYDDGKFTGAPDTWITGLAGARAGVIMRAAPRVGTSSYLQGWAPAIEFNDTAKVLKVGQRTCVPARCYDDVLVTDEYSPDEPDAHQQKFYAPGPYAGWWDSYAAGRRPRASRGPTTAGPVTRKMDRVPTRQERLADRRP
jgi:hypothetical protein